MRKRLILLLTPIAALAAIAVSASVAASPTASTAAAATCATVTDGQLTIGTDNPAYPPWYAGGRRRARNGRSTTRRPARATSRPSPTRSRSSSATRKAKVTWTYVPFNKAFAPGPKPFDFDINQISYHARAREGRLVQRLVLRREPGDRRQQGDEDRGSPLHRGPARRSSSARSSARRATRSSRTAIKPTQQPAVFPPNAGAVLALKNKQIDGLVVDLPTAFYVTAVQVPNGKILGQFENERRRRPTASASCSRRATR